MDLFGKKQIAQLKADVEYLQKKRSDDQETIERLKKPVDDKPVDDYRNFTVTLSDNNSFVVRCRYFTVDVTGYKFHEADPTWFGYLHSEGRLKGHIPSRHVLKVLEVTE